MTNSMSRPKPRGEVRRAGRVIGEPRLERGARHWAIVFTAARHAGTLREHTGSVNASTQSVRGCRNQRDKPHILYTKQI
jgi:hypothetical protein